jgi:hypothetical protein
MQWSLIILQTTTFLMIRDFGFKKELKLKVSKEMAQELI